MEKTYIFDLSRTLLFPTDKKYKGSLNGLYGEIKDKHDFKFEKYFYLDEGMLNYAEEIKNKYKCDLYIFTSGSIQNDHAIKGKLEEIFKDIFSAEKLEVNKSDINAYKKLPDLVNCKPDEIIYIDDVQENVEMARSAGLTAFRYADVKNIKKKLRKHFQSD